MRRYRPDRTLAACLAFCTLAACGDGGYFLDAAREQVVAGSPASPMAGAAPGSDATGQKGGGGGNGGGSGGGGNGNGGGGSSAPALMAEAGVRSMRLTWNDDGVSQYNAYVSSSPDCDIANYALCPDGQMLMGVRSPHKVGGLVNGRVYYAKIETAGTRKTASLSNEAGARPTTLEFNGAVWAIAPAANGTTYLGGEFSRIGLTAGHAVPLDAVSGRPSVPGYAVFDGDVTAAAPDGSGGWYVGGDFQRVGGVAKSYLVHVRGDGSVDANWNPVPDGSVWAIAEMNGLLYIGGRFTTINGQRRVGVAAIDAASGQLMPWNPVPDLGVWTIAAANGTVYLGGTFTDIGGFRRNHLAAIDAFGNVLPWDPDADATVATLAVSGSKVYAGGFFDNVSGEAHPKLVALDATSGRPTPWNGSVGCTACEVRALALSGSTLYVGGRFTQIGGVARNHLAALDTASGNVLSWNPGADYSVWSLAVIRDTRGTTVYAAGDFATIGGQPRGYLAAIDAQGAVLPWQPAPTAHVDVVAAAGAQVIAGGRFTGLGAVARNGLAAIDATGGLTAWNPDAPGTVRALAVSDDRIYAGGNFTTVGGQPRAHLAMLDAAGNVAAWNPAPDRPVLALAVGAEGTLYAGGEFRYVASLPRSYLAAFSAGGALLPWVPSADDEVHALAVGPYGVTGETVYVGGRFDTVKGVVRRRLAQIDALGQPTTWNPWGGELADDPEVVHALSYSNGSIFAGGLFSRLGRNLARITEAGTLVPFKYADLRVWSLVASDGTLTIGGEFTRLLDPAGEPVARTRLAAVDIGTRSVSSWAPKIDYGAVYAVRPVAGSVHAGGSFTRIDDQVVSGFATLAP